MSVQNYNTNDLSIRTAVAACAIGTIGACYAKKERFGSISVCEQKSLQLITSQLDCVRYGFSVLLLPASATVTILSDGATDVDSTITIDGVTISDAFLYTTDNVTTATVVANAINNYTSSPDYTATVSNNVVTITSVTKGSSINGSTVSVVGGDVTVESEFMNGGQDGVLPEDNILTEEEVEHIFNNIAKVTGCCYAPLGYGYESIPSPALGVPLSLNTGSNVLLNTGDPVRLNKPLLIP